MACPLWGRGKGITGGDIDNVRDDRTGRRRHGIDVPSLGRRSRTSHCRAASENRPYIQVLDRGGTGWLTLDRPQVGYRSEREHDRRLHKGRHPSGRRTSGQGPNLEALRRAFWALGVLPGKNGCLDDPQRGGGPQQQQQWQSPKKGVIGVGILGIVRVGLGIVCLGQRKQRPRVLGVTGTRFGATRHCDSQSAALSSRSPNTFKTRGCRRAKRPVRVSGKKNVQAYHQIPKRHFGDRPARWLGCAGQARGANIGGGQNQNR